MAKRKPLYAPMNPSIKAAWVAALRSGRYPQARSRLRQGSAYCCLGVLCDLHGSGWVEDFDGVSWYQGARVQLPPKVRDWAGLTLGPPGALAVLNDDGQDFNAIADWIEANL